MLFSVNCYQAKDTDIDEFFYCFQQVDSLLDPSLVFSWQSANPLAAEGMKFTVTHIPNILILCINKILRFLTGGAS